SPPRAPCACPSPPRLGCSLPRARDRRCFSGMSQPAATMRAMRPSPGNLNRATLERQLLTRRASVDVIAAIRRLVAVQAQQPAAPYVALWNRISDFDFAGLDAALADHTVVKSTLLRITLHLTHHADHAPFRA